jgi:hypothetical protein
VVQPDAEEQPGVVAPPDAAAVQLAVALAVQLAAVAELPDAALAVSPGAVEELPGAVAAPRQPDWFSATPLEPLRCYLPQLAWPRRG